MSRFAYCINEEASRTGWRDQPCLNAFAPDAVAQVCAFHRGLPGYAPTPLTALPALAARLGAAQFLVKDESPRFGLNAFKALGGSYAIARWLCDRLSLPMDEHTFERLRSAPIGGMTFITATDGNHGRGVAWTAKMLGCKAVVYLPKGSARERLENIRALGAEAAVTDWNYDDTVRYASAVADEKGYVLVQDTSWDGYEAIPTAIMQGYTTMAREICEQLTENGMQPPTHLFLQAGVGAMAGAVAAYLTNVWGEKCPKIIVVEPDEADCFYRTASARDGKMHPVTGEMNSMMAGLCCGEPCPIGWEILRHTAAAFVSCDDSYAAYGMRLLGRPAGGDPRVVSGESGAVTAGVAAALMWETGTGVEGLRRLLGMDEGSRILVISTEGATDRVNYERVLRG